MIKLIKPTAIIILIVMFATIITGCNNKPDEQAVPTKVTHVYKSDFITLPEDYELSGGNFCIYNDRIYIMCMEFTDRENYQYKPVLYSFDMNGENVETKYIEVGESEYITQFAIMSDGNIIYTQYVYDYEYQSSTAFVIKLNPDGSEAFKFEAKPLFTAPRDESRYGGRGGDYFSLNYFAVGENDIMYLGADSSVVAVSADGTGTKLFEITVDNWLNSLRATADGKVIISYYDYSPMGGGMVYQYLDPNKKGLGEKIEMPENMGYNNMDVYTGPGYDFYFKNETGLYGCNSKDAEPTLLCNWINSDITSNSINSLVVINPDKFLYSGYDQFLGRQQLCILTKVPDDQVVPKILINLSYVWADTYALGNQVISFNRQSNEYRIVMNDYSKFNSENDWQAGQTQFNLDITTGKIPDIMILASDMPIKSYTQKGLLADFYKFMDNDPDFSKDILLDCVKKPFEVNGKLYRIVSNFNIQTLIGKSSVVGDKPGWTVDEMLALLAKYPEGTALTDDTYGLNSRTYMFQLLLMANLNNFVDYEKATCNFNSPEFIDLLKYVASLPEGTDRDNMINDDYSYYSQNRIKDWREERTLLKNDYLSSYSSYLQAKAAFGNVDITLKGFPTSKGNGSVLVAQYSYAIAERSLCKDGAWQFIKYLLSDDAQDSMRRYSWPATKAGLEQMAKQEMEQYYVFYSSGWSSSSQPFDENTSTSNWDGEEGTPGHLTEEDVKLVNDFINSITNSVDYDQKMLEIILEEAEICFAGDKSAEETAKVIQSRLAIMISEAS